MGAGTLQRHTANLTIEIFPGAGHWITVDEEGRFAETYLEKLVGRTVQATDLA